MHKGKMASQIGWMGDFAVRDGLAERMDPRSDSVVVGFSQV